MTENLNDFNVEDVMKKGISNDLETYEEMLIEAAANKSCNLLPNADKNHAAVAYSVLFDSATSHINLVVESFKGDVSNNPKYVKSITRCLERGITFKVLSLNEPNPDSLGYKKLLEYNNLKNGSVEIKKATLGSTSIIKKSAEDGGLELGETHNFSLFDNDKYRLEFLPTEYMAFLSFNDPLFVSKYKIVFNEAFDLGVPIN